MPFQGTHVNQVEQDLSFQRETLSTKTPGISFSKQSARDSSLGSGLAASHSEAPEAGPLINQQSCTASAAATGMFREILSYSMKKIVKLLKKKPKKHMCNVSNFWLCIKRTLFANRQPNCPDHMPDAKSEGTKWLLPRCPLAAGCTGWLQGDTALVAPHQNSLVKCTNNTNDLVK